MDIGERRAHGDGVQAVQGLGKQAALKAGVDGLDAQLGAKELAIALDKDVADRRMLSIAPAGILELKLGVEAQDIGQRLQAVLELVLQRGDRGARGQHDLDLVVRGGNHADVGGNLDGAVGGDVAANHAVRGKTQGADEGKRGLLVHGLDLGVVGNLDGAGKAGVEDLELGSDVGNDALCDLGRCLGGSVVGVNQNSLALTVDGVVLSAAVKADDGGLAGDHQAVDDAGHDEVAVAALQVDVGAGVTTQQAGDLERKGAAGLVLAHDRAGVGNDDTAGAADGGHALLLGIEVDHGAGANLGLVERLGANQASLLVGGEHALEGRMSNRIVVEHGEHQSDGDTVVGAQRGTVSGEDAILDDQVDTIGRKVVLNGAQLVAHHVDVALQHHGRGILGAGRCGLANDDVVDLVLIHVEAALLGKRDQEIADALLVARPTGDRADLLKEMEQLGGLVAGNLVVHGASLAQLVRQ